MKKVIKLLKEHRSKSKDVQFKAQIDKTLALIDELESLKNLEKLYRIKKPTIIYDNDIPF